MIGGRRYGHIIDPRDGRPIQVPLRAAVIAPEATLAEVLSTALLVLGEREGIALVEARQGCEGLLLDAEAGVWQTSGFQQATAFEPLPGFEGLTAPLSP